MPLVSECPDRDVTMALLCCNDRPVRWDFGWHSLLSPLHSPLTMNPVMPFFGLLPTAKTIRCCGPLSTISLASLCGFHQTSRFDITPDRVTSDFFCWPQSSLTTLPTATAVATLARPHAGPTRGGSEIRTCKFAFCERAVNFLVGHQVAWTPDAGFRLPLSLQSAVCIHYQTGSPVLLGIPTPYMNPGSQTRSGQWLLIARSLPGCLYISVQI